MYPSREQMASKTHELVQLKLFPEALTLAEEMAIRWPEHPCGWSYLAEIYGHWFGLGVKAAESVKRGLACPRLAETVNHEPLLVFAIHYALDGEMLEQGIDGLLRYYPNNSFANTAQELKHNTHGRYSLSVLADWQLTLVRSIDVKLPFGVEASHQGIAVYLLEKMGDVERQSIAVHNLLEALRNADQQMKALREHYGLDFVPGDDHTLRHRAQLFVEYADDFFPNDAQMLNRWAATYRMLEDFDHFHRITERVLAIKRYDKPLVNKAEVLMTQGAMCQCRRDFEPAKAYYGQAIACLHEALSLGGEGASQARAKNSLQAAQAMMQGAQSGLGLGMDYNDFNDHVNGLQRLFLEEMRHWAISGIKFTPEMIAPAFQRFDVRIPAQAEQLICEFLEDFNPAVAAAILSKIKPQGDRLDYCVHALLLVAGNPQAHGAMHRLAMQTFAMFLLNGKDYLKVYALLKHYADKFPSQQPVMLSSIELTFGLRLGQILRADLINPPTIALPSEHVPFWKKFLDLVLR